MSAKHICYRDGCETRIFRRGLCEDHYWERVDEDLAAEDADREMIGADADCVSDVGDK